MILTPGVPKHHRYNEIGKYVIGALKYRLGGESGMWNISRTPTPIYLQSGFSDAARGALSGTVRVPYIGFLVFTGLSLLCYGISPFYRVCSYLAPPGQNMASRIFSTFIIIYDQSNVRLLYYLANSY
jgi:hypothetical protein